MAEIRLRHPHRDDWIEKTADLADDGLELSHMGIGEVALIGRRLDEFDRQRRQHQPAASVGLPIHRQHLPAVFLDCPMQLRDLPGRRGGLQFNRGQADRCAGRSLPSFDRNGAGALFSFRRRHGTYGM